MNPLTQLQRLHSPVCAPANQFRLSFVGGSIDYWINIDRVNVLHGHSGCVNALSWSTDGQTLVSGGDDRTIRLWKLDSSDFSTPSPFQTFLAFQTGHAANIFNAQFLSSSSSTLATCAGDGQIRVFDLSRPTVINSTTKSSEAPINSLSQSCELLIQCHEGAVKRICTEESDSHFLSVSEDGTVRQHDLRCAHRCLHTRSNCPQPLIRLPFELSTLSTSVLTPYSFVVAGESQYAYLFDRRYCNRTLLAEWGTPCSVGGMVTSVRRLGRSQVDSLNSSQDHITGVRMSPTTSHEVLLSYSGDAVYLFNVQDEPDVKFSRSKETPDSGCSTMIGQMKCSNALESQYHNDSVSIDSADSCIGDLYEAAMMEVDDESGAHSSKVPVVFPRIRFSGACNMETVKDVNYLGHSSQLVTSGSDDGNFFIWRRDNGELVNILEGDGTVVNVIEENPRFKCCAVSGIDHTVMIFSSNSLPSKFSRIAEREEIVRANIEMSRRVLRERERFFELLARHRQTRRTDEQDESSDDEEQPTECLQQ